MNVPPMRLIAAACAVATCIGYSIGYLLIDALHWITLTAGQARDGNLHVFRVFVGFLVMAIPMLIWQAWESRMDTGG